MILIVNLWNLIESFREINKACEILKENDKQFREVLEANRPHFIANLRNVDSLLGSILTLMSNERYDMLPGGYSCLFKNVRRNSALVLTSFSTVISTARTARESGREYDAVNRVDLRKM
jgi:hypothetical protein